jgi:hypothetical protein
MSVYTLLEIVQDVHNDLNLDLVNTIGDTPDSQRVAQIAKTVYFEFIARRDWPHLRKLGRLSSLVDLDQRTGLLIPQNTKRIEWIKYNVRKDSDVKDNYQTITFLYPDDFLDLANTHDTSKTYVEQVETPTGASFSIRNDQAPQYWTSFDDNIVYFNSYDSAVENTVQGNKTQVLLYTSPQWVAEDTAVPNLPVEAFPGYLAEVKSTASLKINEIQDAKSEQQATRQQRRLSNESWRAYGGIRKPDYGRRTKGSRHSNHFPRD